MFIFNIISWFNSIFVKSKRKFSRTVNPANNIKTMFLFQNFIQRKVEREAFHIDMDPLHPINASLQLFPSGNGLR